jgi:hypothetical protein
MTESKRTPGDRLARSSLLRYAGWAVGGAATLLLVFLVLLALEAVNSRRLDGTQLKKSFSDGSGWVLLAAMGATGIVLVMLRAGVGMVTRLPPSAADRATGRGLLRFGVGILGGCVVAGAVVAACNRHVGPGYVFPGGKGPEDLGLWMGLAGGLALVVAGPLVRWWVGAEWAPRGLVRLLPAWASLFALAVTLWLACDVRSRTTTLGIVRGEPCARRHPLSYWLNEITSPDKLHRRDALWALGDIGTADAQAVAAVTGALADPDDEVFSTATYEIEKNDLFNPDTVRALGQTLRVPGRAGPALSALSRASATDLGPVIPDLCRMLTVSQGSDSTAFELLRKYDPALELPKERFDPSYHLDRPRMEANAVLVARAVRKLGPAAESAYRSGLRTLLTSEDPMDRRFAAYSVGGFGPDAKEDAAALVRITDKPVNFADSDAGPAALALARIGDSRAAARAFAAMLARRGYRVGAYYADDIDPCKELKRLPPDALADLPPEAKRLIKD